MKNVEIITTKQHKLYCAGEEVPYDHPKIYLEIDDNTNEVVCPYCSRKFISETK